MSDYISKYTGSEIDEAIGRIIDGLVGGEIPNFGTENAGKLVYIGENGEATILNIGTGLQIVDGVLSVIGGSSGGDPGDTETLAMSVDDDGHATLAGATLTVENGVGSLAGATLTVTADGSATIA
jgi:hypothetical protein